MSDGRWGRPGPFLRCDSVVCEPHLLAIYYLMLLCDAVVVNAAVGGETVAGNWESFGPISPPVEPEHCRLWSLHIPRTPRYTASGRPLLLWALVQSYMGQETEGPLRTVSYGTRIRSIPSPPLFLSPKSISEGTLVLSGCFSFVRAT